MKVNIYPINSQLHNEDFIMKQRNQLIKELTRLTPFEYALTTINDMYNSDLTVILVETGGSEFYYKKIESIVKEPIYLITFGNNNSLAASIEILAYIQSKGMDGEILHGSFKYMADRITKLMEKKNG